MSIDLDMASLTHSIYDLNSTHSNTTHITEQTDTNNNVVLLLDADTYWYFRVINYVILGQPFVLFGIVANTINMAMFIKMGFKDPINVSFLGLSTSDFFSCITMAWSYLTRTPGFMEMDLPFEPVGTGYATGTWPHFIFVKITSGITAFITLERCLCVTFPLKIKEIITTRRVCVITVGIYVFVLAMAAPIFYVNRLAYKPNVTVLQLIYTEDRSEIEPIVYALLATVLPLTFVGTIVFTVLLVQTLKNNAKWKNTASANNDNAPSRDVKVARMVVILSSLFIACFTPVMILTIFLVFFPDFRKGGSQENVTLVIASFIYLLETANASLNIVIYYFRSSNFKAAFDGTFRRNEKAVGPM